jgi:beta-glucosidase
MRMPQAQNDLIKAVAAANKNVIVVMSAGSAVEMPWFSDVKAILHGYLGGQAGASAMLNVLTGKHCPSGKLNETYPYHYEDTPAYRYYPSKERSSEYREGLYVGYRYYSTVGKEVQFPFGYGLSYTSFAYSNLHIEQDKVTFTLKNTGSCDGAEIAQLYIGKASETVFRPKKELKGFAKVFLKAGEEKEVTISFDDKTFRFYDTRTNTWEIEKGEYQVIVGANAADEPLYGTVFVEGTVAEGRYKKSSLPDYFTGKITNVGDGEYQILYEKEIPDGHWSKEIQMNDAVCQLNHGRGIFGWIFWGVLTLMLKISEWRGKPSLNVLFNYNMPIRGYAKMTGGFVTMDMARALTEMANGHRIKGTGHLIRACFKRN